MYTMCGRSLSAIQYDPTGRLVTSLYRCHWTIPRGLQSLPGFKLSAHSGIDKCSQNRHGATSNPFPVRSESAALKQFGAGTVRTDLESGAPGGARSRFDLPNCEETEEPSVLSKHNYLGHLAIAWTARIIRVVYTHARQLLYTS